MGYWKGSGMALALDMAAALMANGMSGTDMDIQAKGSCTNCCQIFIAYDPYLFGSKDEIQDMLNRRLMRLKKLILSAKRKRKLSGREDFGGTGRKHEEGDSCRRGNLEAALFPGVRRYVYD